MKQLMVGTLSSHCLSTIRDLLLTRYLSFIPELILSWRVDITHFFTMHQFPLKRDGMRQEKAVDEGRNIL